MTTASATARVAGRRPRRVTPGAAPWLPVLLLPICIGLGVVYFCAVEGLALGFTDWNLISSPAWVGLDNFAGDPGRPAVLDLDAQHRRHCRADSAGQAPHRPRCLALLMMRVRRGGAFFRLALFFPATCSVVAVAFVWTYLYDVDGILNKLLVAAGAEPVEWMSTGRALWSVSAMIIWAGVGYVALLFYAGLQAIPQEYYDAAMMDGAGRVQRLRHLTLPLLSPTSFFVIVTSVISALQTFGEVYVLSGPLDSTLTIMGYIYERAFTSFAMGYAAALSAFLIVVILIVTLIQLRLQRTWVTYDT